MALTTQETLAGRKTYRPPAVSSVEIKAPNLFACSAGAPNCCCLTSNPSNCVCRSGACGIGRTLSPTGC